MATERVAVDPVSPDVAAIRHAAGVIRAGGLVAFPTETVYGLGADATNPSAVDGIYRAKGRDRDDPLIVHIAAAAELSTVATRVPGLARALADVFWPGPLTVVAIRHPRLAPAVSGGRDTVAVRVPRHPVALALIREAGVPIAAPSANRFMHTSPTTAAHVLSDLDGRIDLILDAGPVAIGVESTVIAVDGQVVRVLRPGGVTAEALADALAVLDPGAVVSSVGGKDAGASPGALARHYAPHVPLTLVTGSGDLTSTTAALVSRLTAERRRVGLCADDRILGGTSARASVVASFGQPDDGVEHARRLFAAIRTLEAAGVDRIVAAYPRSGGLGAAILDRLQRAADEVIDVPA